MSDNPVPRLTDDNTFTIANGASLSSARDLQGRAVSAILMPATWDTAALTFQGSIDGVTYANIYDTDGVQLTVAADASRMIQIAPGMWMGVNYLKIRSGTSGAPVVQTGARSIVVVSSDLGS